MRKIILLILLNLSLIPIYFVTKLSFQPQVLIIPHHNVVQVLRQQIINEVAHRRVHTKTVIILSPDHFNPSQSGLTTTKSDWVLANGVIQHDQFIGAFFSTLNQNDAAVKNDHGIYNLLPDIHAAFPQAKIVPILIGQSLKATQLEKLSQVLISTCHTTCLLIASVDFSHYLPAQLADVHDAFSLKAISNLDDALVMNAEVDSPQSLYLTLQFAKAHHSSRFVFKAHTNSGKLVNNYDVETTSHILGWFQPGLKSPINSQTFVYAHDLDRKLNQNTLGDRFFYGADITNTQNASISADLVLAGITWNNHRQLMFLPLSSDHAFLRGQAKQNALQNLNLPNSGLINYP